MSLPLPSASFHEHGLLDLPAMMDHVLAVTGQRSLLYAAHSLGATALLVMASLRLEHAPPRPGRLPHGPRRLPGARAGLAADSARQREQDRREYLVHLPLH